MSTLPTTHLQAALGTRGAATLVPSSVPGLSLLPVVYDPWAVAPKRASRQSHWLRQISELDVDYVVVNLGASMAPATLDLFADADVQICVAAPEPPAIEATYRFCRAYFVRRLRRALMRERFKLRVVERALAGREPGEMPQGQKRQGGCDHEGASGRQQGHRDADQPAAH